MAKLPVLGALRVPNIQIPRLRTAGELAYASVMHDRLMREIGDFEENLQDDEQVGAYLASFGRSVDIIIDDIGYHNPYLIVFYGRPDDGAIVELVQHVTQLSVLLTAKKLPDPNDKPKRIGFTAPSKENEGESTADSSQPSQT